MMVNNPTFQFKPSFKAPQSRIVVFAVLAILLAVAATIVTLTASATPPNAAEVRIQGWVEQLKEDRLTAQRHTAQQQLEGAGEAAVAPLLIALRSNNVVLRRNAADMLGFIASPTSSAALQDTLANDSVPAVRRNAAYALGEIGTFEPIAALQQASVLDTNALVRQTAQDSLARIHTRIALSAGIDDNDLNSYAVAPSNVDTLYAATGRDLKVTNDGGKTWTNFSKTLPSLTNQLAVSPSDPLTLYAAVDSLGMFKSVDGGKTWATLNTGLQVGPGLRISSIAVDPSNAEQVLIATGVLVDGSQAEFLPTGIMRSTDGGATWTLHSSHPGGLALTNLTFKGTQLYALSGQKVMVYRIC
jgi:hypothetical protein